MKRNHLLFIIQGDAQAFGSDDYDPSSLHVGETLRMRRANDCQKDKEPFTLTVRGIHEFSIEDEPIQVITGYIEGEERPEVNHLVFETYGDPKGGHADYAGPHEYYAGKTINLDRTTECGKPRGLYPFMITEIIEFVEDGEHIKIVTGRRA